MPKFAHLLLIASALSLGCSASNVEEFEACNVEGETDECGRKSGEMRYCGMAMDPVDPEEPLEWSYCVDPETIECTPGESEECFLEDGEPISQFVEGSTPLVLVFDAAPVTYAAVPASAASFDINTTGECGAPAWPSANTPWLALDRDRSGSIEAGDELFGSGTRLANGARASQGFAALAQLDSDGDGRITQADSSFADLVLWGDHDADRRSTAWELTSLSSAGIIAIDLAFRDDDPRCDVRGNCEIERAVFEFEDRYGVVRSGEVVDIHVTCEE